MGFFILTLKVNIPILKISCLEFRNVAQSLKPVEMKFLEKAFEQYRIKSTLVHWIYTYEFQNKLLNSGMQTLENIIDSPPILVLQQIYCTL
jgi:hypothetical protein